MRNLIEKLSCMRGISGFEYRITPEIADMFRKYTDDVTIDTMGNVIAVKKCGKDNAPKIMIESHCDEIGLMVMKITDEGFITFTNVGGVDSRILPSSEVVIHGKEDVYGAIGIKPDCMQENGKTAKMKSMAIDTGLSADKVKELISVGDSITFPQSVGILGENQFSGKSLDDRASLAAVLDVMKNLQAEKLDVDVYAVAAVQEEVGCRGAKTAAFAINPDIAIAIDVTHGITPDNSKDAFDIGCGAVISVGPNLHPKLTKRLFKTAQEHDIKVETEVDGGDTGTDAWEIQVSQAGIATALLSLPLKYMHTSVETIAVSDAEAVSQLLSSFIKDLKGGDLSWLTF